MTHQIPNAMKAIEPYLRDKVKDPRFWDGQFDTTHIGEIDIPPMDQKAKEEMWSRYQKQVTPNTIPKTTNQFSDVKRVKIKVGSRVLQDRSNGIWPSTASAEKVDPDMIFEAKWTGKVWDCVADGFGMLKINGQTGEYGNGSIFAFGIDSVEVID
jgi:hypothetical protein